MDINRVPPPHLDDNPTGCCPRFHPEDWEGVELRFRDKRFVRAVTHSALHVPIDMGRVFGRVLGAIEAAGADDPEGRIVLSRDLSAWKAEHLFAVSDEVAGEEMTTLSGTFITRVFEGPFSGAGAWYDAMKRAAAARGKPDGAVWFYYTTCPKCGKVYGKNHVVGLAEV